MVIPFLVNYPLTNSLQRLNRTLTDWHLGLVFPPAVGRGARLQRRRRRQKGAASEKPAHLLCEHEEDRNRRSPRPRGPNAEKAWYRGGLLCSAVFVLRRPQTQDSFLIRRSKSFSGRWRRKCFCSARRSYRRAAQTPRRGSASNSVLPHSAHMVWIRRRPPSKAQRTRRAFR